MTSHTRTLALLLKFLLRYGPTVILLNWLRQFPPSYKHFSLVKSLPHWMSQLILFNHHSRSKWTNRCNQNGIICAPKWLIARHIDEKYSKLLLCKIIYIILKTFDLEWYKAQCFKMRMNTWACLYEFQNFSNLHETIFTSKIWVGPPSKSCRLSPYVGLWSLSRILKTVSSVLWDSVSHRPGSSDLVTNFILHTWSQLCLLYLYPQHSWSHFLVALYFFLYSFTFSPFIKFHY